MLDTCGGIFDVDQQRIKIAELETKMAATHFWDDVEAAQKTVTEAKQIKQSIATIEGFQEKLDDLKVLYELVGELEEAEQESHLQEIESGLSVLKEDLDRLETQSLLNGPHDISNAIMSIHAGAGGTESCDWAEMLLRMYTRWAERNELVVALQDIQPGEEAGMSRVTFSLNGPYAYGYAKAERGVHRLVRISPFDSNARRHTSFCAVDVIAEVDEEIDIEIKPDELRVDTFRSSGKGGQHLNKTDSAVRMTHLPTGMVAVCQNERSQIKNRATALKVLKSRLYEKMLDEKRSSMEQFYGGKTEIAWGNQIRSYVFQPYQLVTDLRTSLKIGNVQDVMDGGIEPFINAWLLKKGEQG